MPYSNDERDQLEFYQEFVDDLRDGYTKKVKRFFPTFRDSDNIMYSYEDILTGLGLEDANIEDPLWKIIAFKLSEIILTKNLSGIFVSKNSSL